MKFPLEPATVLVLEKLIRTWKGAARAALDPGSYEVSESIHLEVSGQLRIGEPVVGLESVQWARVAGLALAKCSEATRAAIAREYHGGRDEKTVREDMTVALDLDVKVRDGSARAVDVSCVDLTDAPIRLEG